MTISFIYEFKMIDFFEEYSMRPNLKFTKDKQNLFSLKIYIFKIDVTSIDFFFTELNNYSNYVQ